jgi:DNA-directed RNA polymerase subunit RPC12/RpoP
VRCARCDKKLRCSDIEYLNVNWDCDDAEMLIECQDCSDLCDQCDNERNEEVKMITFFLMKDGSIKPEMNVSEDDHMKGLVEDVWRVTCPECGNHGINLRELEED